MTAVVGAGFVWLVNWLGTRTGDGQWPSLARLLSKILMVGVAKTPTYSAPAPVEEKA